jgi:two-component system phosphate regulon response regulator PhoB
VRSVLYRFPDLDQFEQVLRGAEIDAELDLGLPAGATVLDGEWVLAIFELGPARRATSAAARAVLSPDGARLTFEPRDWQRLAQFARHEARRPPSIPDVEESSWDSMSPLPGMPGDATVRARWAKSPMDSAPPEATAGGQNRRSNRPSQRPSGRGSRVLVIDDDPDIREMVTVMLEAVGLVVSSAGSAEEALARIQEHPFELLVLDWNLPRMSGIDLCRRIRQDPELGEMPVLFLTANASSQDMVDAFASGADDYVVKPFRAPELGARIFSLLRRTRRA